MDKLEQRKISYLDHISGIDTKLRDVRKKLIIIDIDKERDKYIQATDKQQYLLRERDIIIKKLLKVNSEIEEKSNDKASVKITEIKQEFDKYYEGSYSMESLIKSIEGILKISKE